MRKSIKALILILIFPLLLVLTVNCNASEHITKLNDLIENSIAMDGKEVTVEGEAIGEILERGNYAWINMNDSSNSIGVWIEKDSLKELTYFGNYKTQGDIVKLTGTYHRACIEHGGDVDIHCNSIKITSSGNPIERPLSIEKLWVALLLSFITILFVLYYIREVKKKVTQ